MAGTALGSGQKAANASDSKKTVDKRSLWQLGTYYSGFGDSLARSDDGHGALFAAEQQQHQPQQQQHFGGGWHQEYQPLVQQQHHHQWAQVQSVSEHEPKAHPVHEWQADQGAGLHGQEQHHFLADHVPTQHHFGGSFEQPKVEQPASFDWHHQQLLHQAGGSSQEWQHDDAKEADGGHGGHGDWAPIAGAGGSSDLHKEHTVKSISSETKEHQHQEWAPAEGKEHHEEHHHTKIIKVPYPVHIEKPYPVYIEKPFIVEKPVPLKLYIKKKHH
ncbi:hypothetical protein ZHAS_00015943 [Anopheles sinensis]|uniref:Uncharacterized protein n=1 Tax=Anopheles sinensis TaxID=74873 RepID=A0A084WCE3_ANOSI|nr:hypothetical protein ZHAS_00015943 [Anopheles sinensis]